MQFKKYTNQRLGSIQGLRSFKDTLPTKIKKIINKKGVIYTEILDNWKYIAGNELFKFSFPKKYKSSNRFNKSSLEIMVKRGKEIDLEYSKQQIISNINSFFGYNVVEKIKIFTFEDDEKSKNLFIKNASKKKFHSILKNVKDINLKTSMKNLINVYKKNIKD